MNTHEFIIVHHTGGSNSNPLADTSHHTAAMVDTYHKSLGWDGIGYNWFIQKDGKVVQGRSESKQGAHTIGYNEKSVGVCLAGNFDVTLPTKEQEKSLIRVLNDIRVRYTIPLEKIVPHRVFANKTCYGNKLPEDWARKLLAPIDAKQAVLKKLEELRTLIEQTL